MLLDHKKVKDRQVRRILNAIDYFDGLPFSKLNIAMLDKDIYTPEKISNAIKELERLNMLYGYCPLADVDGCKTSQFEHTIIVGHDRAFITTRI